jgi:hypothetical protein
MTAGTGRDRQGASGRVSVEDGWKRKAREIRAQVRAPLVAGLAVFALLQLPHAERTFLGAPDRDMLETAFKLREGVAGGPADPVLWLDLDLDALRAAGRGPEGRLVATAPRATLADALTYARRVDPRTGQGARLVLLDVDLAWPDIDAGAQAKLERELAAWAQDPDAPLLLLAREALTVDDGRAALPATAIDALVAAAPNMAWAGVGFLADGSGGVREFAAGQCLAPGGGGGSSGGFMPSAILFAAAAHALPPDAAPAAIRAAAARLHPEARARCAEALARGGPTPAPVAGGRVAWHLGHGPGGAIRTARVAAPWRGGKPCGLEAPPPALTRASLADIAPAPTRADASALCGRMVVIGGDNPLLPDHAATPYGLTPGPVILANAMRGLVNAGPLDRAGWHPGRLALQLILLVLTVVAISGAFDAVARWRRLARRIVARGRGPVTRTLGRLASFLVHPLVFKFTVALTTFALGAIVTAFGLEHGFWGVLSAPTYCAALTEAWRQLNADRRRARGDEE